MFVAMVKSQFSCFQSFTAQPEFPFGEVDVAEQVGVISIGDRTGALAKTSYLGAVLGQKVSFWVGTLAIATTVFMGSPVLAAGLSDWSYSAETGAIGFALDSAAKPKHFLMANPMRIVVDLPGSSANLQELEAQSGGVFTSIRAANIQAGQTRLVLQLAPGTVLQPGQVELTALGGGRWSLQPLLADGFEPEPEFMAEGAPVVTVLPSLDARGEEPEFTLPSLEAMETAAAAKEEFVSMEETLERQKVQGVSPLAVAVPQDVVPVADRAVSWGSSELPPVPTNFASAIAAAPQVQAIAAPAVLPQLPQPRLGQAPLAFNPSTNASLVDPAQIVDTRPLRQTTASFSPRPPAAVEPVIDPKLLSLDEQQQSAAALGGQTGLVLNRNFVPAARRSVAPQSARQVAVPVVAPKPVVQPFVVDEPVDDSVPFLVEFGAPLPGVGQ